MRVIMIDVNKAMSEAHQGSSIVATRKKCMIRFGGIDVLINFGGNREGKTKVQKERQSRMARETAP